MNRKIALFTITSLIVGITAGYFMFSKSTSATTQSKVLRLQDPEYPLINPLIGSDSAEATNIPELANLKNKISNLVDDKLQNKYADKISVYFRDLNQSRWVGVNPDQEYSPASLFKVPLMIAYYHLAETNPTVLLKQITFTDNNDFDSIQTIQPTKKLKEGQSYTVDELINYMIMYSDNNAMSLLLANIDSKVMDHFFSDFGILLPKSNTPGDFLSPKSYSLFFRVLYGSTYLNHQNSQKALELLSKSVFKDGIVSGVSPTTIVAHKFGEYQLVGIDDSKEFHDCGIIYYPRHPYFLCVMTKGRDMQSQESIIKEVSQLVSEQVTAIYKNE